jgi:2,3-bisphosphoglycerate-independent phosphoglycerate mutase
MDRDNRWERIKKTYDLLVNGKGARFNTASEGIIASYISNISDEFIKPFIVDPEGTICDNDVVINFNFRTDRPREITIALSQRAIPEFEMQPLDLYYCSMTNYDSSFKNIHVAFEKDNLKNTLGEVISNMDLSQIRIAETEKYPHVSYFFSGGREEKFRLEERIMVNSPKVATYDLQPEMSAVELSDKIIHYMQDKQPNFICLNFANPDMLGHTGVYDAIVKAVEKVDQCLKSVVEIGLGLGYEFLVIADHGNADFALNEDGSPNTAHSLNPVPIILVTKEKELKLSDGILADVAPTILDRLRLAAPIEMTGSTLVINNQ